MNNLKRRQAGVLLHPTSLPGPSSCGDLHDVTALSLITSLYAEEIAQYCFEQFCFYRQ